MKPPVRIIVVAFLALTLPRQVLAGDDAAPTPAVPEAEEPASPPEKATPAAAPRGSTSSIVLRTGEVVEGVILDRLPNGYLVRFANTTKVVTYEEVASVDPPPAGAAPAERPAPSTLRSRRATAVAPVPEPDSPREHLGKGGQIMISQSFGFLSQRDDTLTFKVNPALNFFVSDFLTLGLEASYYRTSTKTGSGEAARTTSSSEVAGVFVIGVHAPFGDVVSVWPNIGVGLVHPDSGSDLLIMGMGLTFLVHPAPHFFLGLTPGFDVLRPMEGSDQSFTYIKGLNTLIGGWW